MSVNKKYNYEIIRKGLQILFVIYIFIVSLGHTFNWEIGENLHGICPFGAVETFHSWITTGKFIHHTGAGNSFIALGLLLTLIFTGAFFCGWICPFGTVQELIGKIGKKIFGKKYNNIIPKTVDSVLRYFKYIFLVFILFQTARTFKLVFENVDPYYTLFNIWSDEIAVSGYIVLAVFVALSFIIERPYCRYVCPLGAINGIFNIKSLFTIKRDEHTCISCGACDRACPVGIKVSKVEEVKDTACIRCMKCVISCPVNAKSDTLKVKSISKNKKVMDEKYIPIIAVILFAFPIIAGIATGSFEEESDKKYETVNDIRGSYTIPDIVNNYKITEKELIHAFNIENDKEKKLNMLLEEQGHSLETLREVIGNLDNPASQVIEKIPGKYDGSLTLRELIKAGEPGKIVKLLGDMEVEGKSGKTVIELKRNSMLVDVKNVVKDYDDFLTTFGIPKDAPLNTTFGELINEYGFEMSEVKAYVEENQK